MTEQIMRDNLTALAQGYATATKRALSTVSKEIHGKHSFLEDFIAGRASTTVKTYFLMVDRLRRLWPKRTGWPVTRPVPALTRQPFVEPPPRAPRRMPPRGDGGKFLGKKVPKGKRR